MGAQLAASRTPIVAATPPRTIAVLALDAEVRTADVADGLSRALETHGSVAELHSGTLATLDQAERDADRVVLLGNTGSAEEEWQELCIAEADLVLAVTSGTPEPKWLGRATELHGCELLVLGKGVADPVIAALRPRELQVVADVGRRREALEATARRLVGRALGVVLSGGGARALAHIGVLEELRAQGVRFDRIAGVSLGSLVAAATAADFTAEAIHEGFKHGFVDTNPSNDFVLPAYSLVRGAKARRLLHDAFGDLRIEELPRRFFCLSCDLVAREAVLHRTGPVADAVYPSFAIPGVFPPVPVDERLLVDGAVLDNLPVATMARSGEGPVIAVDVSGRIGQFKRSGRPGVARLGRPLRRALTGSDAEIPRLGETMVRTMTVGSIDTVAAARLHADLVITPRVDGIGLVDWKSLERVRELGRQAASEALHSKSDLSALLGI
jgi:predicted acylesterase/phospholipase RssA